MKTVSTDNFRTEVQAGTYIAKTAATIVLCLHKGDSLREVEYTVYKPGDSITVPETVNGFWYGLAPNGDFINGFKIAEIERVEKVESAIVEGAENQTQGVW